MKKKEGWIQTLLSFALPCRGKMTVSVLFAIISVAGGFVPYLGVYQIIRMFIDKNITTAGLLQWCGVCLSGYAVQVAFYAFSTMLAHISAYTILDGLRRKVADRLMYASLGTVMSKPIGTLKSTIVDRIEDIEPPLAHMIPELSSNVLLPVIVAAALFTLDWRMGLASLATVPVALIPMAVGMKTYNSKYAGYMAANANVNSIIVEYVEGIEVVKAFNQATSSYEKFAGSVRSFRDFTMEWFKATWASMNLCLSILPTTLLAVLPVGILLYRSGDMAPAKLALCLMLALGIVGPLVKATTFINVCKSMEYAVQDTRELLDMEELPEAKHPAQLHGSNIILKDVSFSYTGKTQEGVLHHIDLEMLSGTFTALVGPSGCGKSTVARLIARFWDVTEGAVSIGGVDVRDIPLKQLANQVSFVTQDNFLFECSLKENIRLGKPAATDEEVFAAARAAQCEEFISRLERGWDTPAGDAGKQLSGGERQRIAIARAILKDSPIVILDEATAFTDLENEDKIQQSILALSKGKTLLVIAHRLSTIQNADQIVVLQKGEIVDRGVQKELLSRCPLYQKLWQAHVGSKHWAVGAEAIKIKEEQAYV
ncbi:ABC transporter ATP-binding protein/permease [Lacrimispora sp. NSJ-141]|uniref:ABC transporter ATP-binding protein/permease n=1 Tax=Lientehia hominis TaxID=2897778 RepID=A0AAP2RIM0_9FIRM|nr:ABC transporter ATP-binding protein [Lientehia hominis]MCD2491580.1 ABC transporter ATP-binding protein/permease [Lientehia hominis]